MSTIDMLCPHCGFWSPAEGMVIVPSAWVLVCHHCRKSVWGRTGSDSEIMDYYPEQSVTVDSLVPEPIGHDYLEAQRCYSVAAWQACSVMARRCIHLIVE